MEKKIPSEPVHSSVETVAPPSGLTAGESCPVVFVDASGVDMWDPRGRRRLNDAIYCSLLRVHPEGVQGQALVKVHIGEPRCVTRMRPEFIGSTVNFLKEEGASGVAAGDTTVAYTGSRGARENPPRNSSVYMDLARRHGWSVEGPAGVPFVVLDRPGTSVKGVFEFKEEEVSVESEGIRRYRSFNRAGGFEAADFVVNHAHLTLHGLAGVAGCVKSLAMGCSSIRGKRTMHQAMLPEFDMDVCTLCGRCVQSCPEGALEITEEAPTPRVNEDLCIGCGECEAVCSFGRGAVELKGRDITDWSKGEDTLPFRMADYVMGLMSGRWSRTLNVLHIYNVTERCDCVDVTQEPFPGTDRGFLIGRNPFAVDLVGGRILAAAIQDAGLSTDTHLLESAGKSAGYVKKTYGIVAKVPVEKVEV